jgi:hypothetical protein
MQRGMNVDEREMNVGIFHATFIHVKIALTAMKLKRTA